jgi:hypothetical protein
MSGEEKVLTKPMDHGGLVEQLHAKVTDQRE